MNNYSLYNTLQYSVTTIVCVHVCGMCVCNVCAHVYNLCKNTIVKL